MIHRGSRKPRNLHRGARTIDLLLKGDRTIYISPRAFRSVTQIWLEANCKTLPSTVWDADGRWFEVSVELPDTFTGDASTGWTGPMVSGKPDIHLGLFYSTNLTTWSQTGWIPAPGKSPETLSGGSKRWHARYQPVPQVWLSTLSDLRLTSTRLGKSITAVSVGGSPVSLPNFPYAMPAAVATLQADLRTAGFDDTVVSSTSASLTVQIRNHTVSGARVYGVTMSGSDVTQVRDWLAAPITLGGYPYSMPGDRADLQADLRSAGHSGAVVSLFGDPWEIFIPDRLNERQIEVIYTPGDPYPAWDIFGAYLGELPANRALSSEENLRNPSGLPLAESPKGFARVGLAH